MAHTLISRFVDHLPYKPLPEHLSRVEQRIEPEDTNCPTQSAKFDEADDDMVGLKYLLTSLVREIEAIADLVGDSSTDYVAKAEMSHA